MKYLIIGLAVVIVLVIIYMVVTKQKDSSAQNAAMNFNQALPPDNSIVNMTGAGAGSNIAGNQPAPAVVTHVISIPVCKQKCQVFHPFNRSKREACIANC